MGEYSVSNYDGVAKEVFDFSKQSSIGVGGIARMAFYPKDVQQIKALMRRLKSDGFKHIVLGNLTNVLPPDKPFQKVVISTKKMVESRIGKQVYVSAGVMSGCFIKACRYAHKSGVEFLTGIPCTLGGALYMNAGVNGKYIAELVESVLVYRDGEVVTLSQSECEYAYKKSVFMENDDIILGATLRLTDSDAQTIHKNEKSYLERRSHLPKGKSMGCVFKNPIQTGKSAGEWIENAGLKGMRLGGAYVAEEHANFIINDGSATAQEIRQLIEYIKERVKLQYGIELQEEIRYLE